MVMEIRVGIRGNLDVERGEIEDWRVIRNSGIPRKLEI